ncbi:MAG: DUF4383 domain-containing protein [Bacteroidota bacterium]
MNVKNTSLFWAIAFVAAGILGFIPNPVVGAGGLFETNVAHNMVHVVTAVAFFIFMKKDEAAQILFMKVFGITYLGVGVMGFIWLGSAAEAMLLGFIRINFLDNFLHLGLGAGILAGGMLLGKKNATS